MHEAERGCTHSQGVQVAISRFFRQETRDDDHLGEWVGVRRDSSPANSELRCQMRN